MKSILKTIPHFIFFILLVIATMATAASKDANNDIGKDTGKVIGKDIGEANGITEAMELYFQAAPMDVESPRKAELLNRAESILAGVIEKNPQSLDAHRKLMGVYLQMRDYRKAIQTMQNAISLSPEDPKLFIALAILYDHQGAYEYALPVLEQALALNPNQPLALEYKASIQQKIEAQRVAMESTTSPHKIASPHSK